MENATQEQQYDPNKIVEHRVKFQDVNDEELTLAYHEHLDLGRGNFGKAKQIYTE